MFALTSKTLIMVVISVTLVALGINGVRSLQQLNPHKPTQRNGSQEVNDLLGVLRNEKLRKSAPDRVVEAIRRLGEIKSVAAIDDLVGLLSFRRVFEWESKDNTTIVEIQPITPANRYPAVGALTQIGKAALPALVKALENHETDSLESKNALLAVQNIFGDQSLEGASYLRAAAMKSQTPLAGQRLINAANRITTQVGK